MKNLSRKSPCLVLIGAGLFLYCAPVLGEGPASPAYSGSFRASYDYRTLGDYEDHDAYGFWYYRARNLGDERVEIYTSGRLHADLDGATTSSYDPFGSISDDSASDIRLLQFYVDVHDPEKTRAIRCGRQYVNVADYIQIDGAQIMLFEKQEIGGRVFLGQPVSDYTSVNGDVFAGASLVGRPWEGNQSRVTYARYRDKSRDAEDDHYFLDMHQRLGDEIRARGYLSVMNEDVRMGGADLFYVSMSDYLFDAVLGIQRWGDYTAGTRAYSPLTEVLGDLEPFTMAHARCTAEVLPWFYLSPGAMVREPDDSDLTNRGFERYDLSFIVEPGADLSTTVALEYWDVEDNERFFGLSGDIRYRYAGLWELVLGAAFADLRYFELADQSVETSFDFNTSAVTVTPLDGTRVERTPDALTYYLRGRWNITEKTALRISGEIEDDSDQEDVGYRVRTSFEVWL